MRRVLRPPAPIDLRRTLAAIRNGGPNTRSDHTGFWWATRTADGAATLHVTATDGEIVGEAWGPGAEHVLDRLPGVVGAEDDVSTFDPPPGLVARLRRQFPGIRMVATGSVFEALLPVIIEQKVAGKEAKRSYRRLLWKGGEPAPGPAELRLQPAPEALASLSYEDFHPLGIERKRADTIRFIAYRAERVEEIAAMDRVAAWARLTAFPGVGKWSAAKVMQVTRGDADAVAEGDYHTPHMVAWNLAGEPRATDERMLELLEPYRGHRARVVRLLKAGGRSEPRYGPRMALREIEAM